jgi:hypothetical protein
MPTLTESATLFANQSKAILAKGAQLAASVAANTAQVWPGGATFGTIQAAINSITGAGPQLQYQVAVGPGTYNETVTMKDYVYVTGSGQGNTIITAQGQQSFVSGVVNTASYGGISGLSIVATGGDWGSCPMGIKICEAGPFNINGVNINSSDSGQAGNNVRGISNETGSYSGSVIIGSSTILVSGSAGGAAATAIEVFGTAGSGNMSYFIELCSIEADGPMSYGVTTAVAATVSIEDSKITGATYALYDSDGMSVITAIGCTINGPVSQGVIIK